MSKPLLKKINQEHSVIVSATEPTGVNRKKVWFKKGKNSFNKTNYIIDLTGKIGFVLDLEKGETYTISSNLPLYVAKFANSSSANGNDVGPQHWGQFNQWTFTAGDNIANVLNNTLFLGISVNTITSNISDFDNYNIQIEKGSAATAYEAYVEPEIYILNSNSVYEKFEKDECKEITLFDGSCTFGNKTICNVPDSIKNIDIYFMCKTATNEINKGIIKVDTSTTRTINETFGMLVACGGTIFAEVEMVFKPNRTIVADYCAIYRNLNSSAEEKKGNSDYIVYKVIGYK